jgi:two-component system, sensor histidine kinase and response regulator
MAQHCILIVEDHELLLRALRDVVEMAGYSVLTAKNGAEALEIMEKTMPALIVADIMMPQMDGYAFYEAVRARAAWVPIPFIFLTAKADREDVLKGRSLGAEDYLTKPFDSEELIVAIQARLARAEAIRRSSEAEFERLKAQIVTAFSHEMRTPLTYVRGYTELALEDLNTSTPESLEMCLRGIKRGADRLTHLVDDLLLLVRIDTGRAADEYRSLAHTFYDPGRLVEQTVRRYIPVAADQGLILESQIARDLPPIWVCESLFTDALGRLIDNGIKFSRGAGRRVVISAQANGEKIDVGVSDEGVGIAADELPHLFERFRQIDREQFEQQGIGLGLAIAREIIRLHSGDITVESTLGNGSTFIIHLPVAGAESDESTPRGPAAQ